MLFFNQVFTSNNKIYKMKSNIIDLSQDLEQPEPTKSTHHYKVYKNEERRQTKKPMLDLTMPEQKMATSERQMKLHQFMLQKYKNYQKKKNHDTVTLRDKSEEMIDNRGKFKDHDNDHNHKQSQQLEIYSLYQYNTEGKNEKLMRCKICQRKVSSNQSVLDCPKCKKKCHITCLIDPNQCPRCNYNIVTQTCQKSQKIPKQWHSKQSRHTQKYITYQPEYEVLDQNLVPKCYKSEISRFKKNNQKCLDKNGNIILPTPDNLIQKYNFLQQYLKQCYQPLPEPQQLPSHFQQVLYIWNFYSTLDHIIKPTQICLYTIQNIQLQIKNQPFSNFIGPILELILLHINQLKYVSSTYSHDKDGHAWAISPMLRIYCGLKNCGLLRYFVRIFWAPVLIQCLSCFKVEEDQFVKQVVNGLKGYAESRMIPVVQFEDKLNILKFAISIIQRSSIFRTVLSNQLKLQTETHSNLLTMLKKKKQECLTNSQKTSEYLRKIIQTIQNHNIYDSMSMRQENRNEIIEKDKKLKKLQQNKKQIQRKLQEFKYSLQQYKNDVNALQFLFDFQYTSKVGCIGRDRGGRAYWYIANTELHDILFVSQQLDNSVKWSFFHTHYIQDLLYSLNPYGKSQKNLHKQIQTLLSHKIIRTNTTHTQSKAREYIKQSLKQYAKVDEQEDKEIINFIDENIKQINLSILRKILIETHHVYNNITRRQYGVWKVNNDYQEKIRGEKFRNLEDVRNFLLQFANLMYFSKDKEESRNKQKKTHLWKNRNIQYQKWKRAVASSNKSNQLFMLALILYLEVATCQNKYQNGTKNNKNIRLSQKRSDQGSQALSSEKSSAESRQKSMDSSQRSRGQYMIEQQDNGN